MRRMILRLIEETRRRREWSSRIGRYPTTVALSLRVAMKMGKEMEMVKKKRRRKKRRLCHLKRAMMR